MDRQNAEIPIKLNGHKIISKVQATNDHVPENKWSNVPAFNGFRTVYDNQPADPETIVKVTYNDSHLFMRIIGHSDSGETPNTEWVFVILKTNADESTYFSVPLAVNHGPHPIRIIYNNPLDAADNRQKIVNLIEQHSVKPLISNQSDGSFIIDLTISFCELDISEINRGDEWGINVLRYFGINDKRRLSSLCPIRYSKFQDGDHRGTHRPYSLHVYLSNEGRLERFYLDALSGKAEEMPLTLWTPETKPKLFYQSYNHKELVFNQVDLHEDANIRMNWISPSNRQTGIEEIRTQRRGCDCVITIAHPGAKEEGLYRLVISVEHPEKGTMKQLQISINRHDLIEAGDRLYSPIDISAKIRNIPHSPCSNEVDELLKLVPERVGLVYAKIPHDPTVSDRNRNFSWDPSNPNIMTSNDDKQMHYPNRLYPENNELTVINSLGAAVQYPFHEDQEGHRYFLSAHIWHLQREYVKSCLLKLVDKDPLGATRIIFRFAEVYPGWVPVTDQTKEVQYPIAPDSGPPFNYYSGMWFRWSIMDLSGLSPLLQVYEKVKQTNALELLSKEVGEDVERKIVDGMFKPSMQFIDTFTDNQFNMNVHNYRGFMRMAIVTGDSRYMHLAVEKLDTYLNSMFMLDGFWKEVTISYHSEIAEMLTDAAQIANGWTDSKDYESPRTGERFDGLDLFKRFPILQKLSKIRGLLAYPDGHFYPVHETSAVHMVPMVERVTHASSLLMPAAGIVKLVKGEGEKQSQLFMSFSPYHGHHHLSPLNLVLYANGQELLPDIGYSHTKYRDWTTSTMSHNTVVVNGKDANASGESMFGGNLTSFVQLGNDVEVVHANQRNAYPELSEYAREPWFIRFAGGEPEQGYVLDLFRVRGGQRHEYTLNGDANHTAYFETDLIMTNAGDYLVEGNPQIIEPIDEYNKGTISDGQYHSYMYVRDVYSSSVSDGNYEIILRTKEDDLEKSGLKLTGFVGQGDHQLFIGKSPSLKGTRIHGNSHDTQAEGGKYHMPKMVLRREGKHLNSNFITTIEPFKPDQEPMIDKVEVLKSDSATGEVVVSITYGNTQDIVLSAPNYVDQPLVVGDLQMEGKMGFVRMVDGLIREMYLSSGTLLKKGNRIIQGRKAVEGLIRKTLRKKNGDLYDALVVKELFTDSTAGRYVIVTHPDQTTTGYKIKEILRLDKDNLLIMEDQDPGFELYEDGSSQLQYYPLTRWNGVHKYTLSI